MNNFKEKFIQQIISHPKRYLFVSLYLFSTGISNSLLIILFFYFPITTWASFSDDLSYQGEIGTSFRQFSADESKENFDYQLNLNTRFSSDYEKDNHRYHFGFFSRIDSQDSSRNIINFDEAYYSFNLNSWTFNIGSNIFNWSVMEFFHPVDNINSKNFDANGDLIERLGQPSLFIKKEFETSYLQFIVLLDYVNSLMPNKHNRNGPQVELQSPQYITEDFKTTRNPNEVGAVVRFVKNFESFDLDIHIARKYDTNYPMISIPKSSNTSPTINEVDIVPYYLRTTQYGAALQGTWEDYIFKFEYVKLDFDNNKVDLFVPPVVLSSIHKEDFSLTAIGIERTNTFQNDHEGTLFLEYQTILGTTIEEARALAPFQRDIALGYRHNFNDFNGHEIIAFIIHDLDIQTEKIYDISHSFRLNSAWKMKSSIRIIDAKKPDDGVNITNFQGLRPIAQSDQFNLSLIRFF